MKRGGSSSSSGGSSPGSSPSSSSYTYREPLHETAIFHYILILLITAALIVSIIALLNTNELKNALVPQTIDINSFLNKLTSHDEMKAYVGVSPLNIVQINSNNIASLQSQIAGLDSSYLGSFIVQYSDATVIYDYQNDAIKGTVNQQQQQLPSDLLAKLYAHPEASDLQGQQPVGGQIDASSLATLKQQFPDVYANAKVGDFLLRYQTKLIIYDYNNDRIVNAVSLG